MSELALSTDETLEFSMLEEVIEQGADEVRALFSMKEVCVNALNALAIIREKKYYRPGYGTFENYCDKRWGISVQHGRRWIAHARVVSNLQKENPMGSIPNERQSRELAHLPDHLQSEVWQQVCEDGQPTAEKVRQAVLSKLQELIDTLNESTPEEQLRLYQESEQAIHYEVRLGFIGDTVRLYKKCLNVVPEIGDEAQPDRDFLAARLGYWEQRLKPA